MLEGSAARFPTILAADGTLPGTSNEGSQFTKRRIRFAVMLLARGNLLAKHESSRDCSEHLPSYWQMVPEL